MANLVLCIPYNKWTFVLGEVYRVLLPGGRLELIDDQIYFPYGEPPKENLFHSVPSSFPAKSLFEDFGYSEFGRKAKDVREKMLQKEKSVPASGKWVVPSTPGTEDNSMVQPTVRLVRPSSPHYVLRRELSHRPHTPTRSIHMCQSRTHIHLQPSPKMSPRVVFRTTANSMSISSPQRSKSPRNPSRSLDPMRGVRLQLNPDPTLHSDFVASTFTGKSFGGKLSQSPIESITSTPTSIAETNSYDISPMWGGGAQTSINSTSPNCSFKTSNTTPTTGRSGASSLNKSEQLKSALWKQKAWNSRNLERVFEKMLTEDFGIHVKPAEFLMDVLSKTFRSEGQITGKVGKMGSYHIKLAPVKIFSGGVATGNGRGTSVAEGIDKVETKINISDFAREAKKDDSVFCEDKKAMEIGKPKSKKKGKELNEWDKICEGKTEEIKVSPVQADVKAMNGYSKMLPPETQQFQYSSVVSQQVQRLSAKAAVRLGISYSELSAAAASTLPPSLGLSSTRSTILFPSSSTRPLQHPGLLIWPWTYIPMGPVELEMHACKYMHTLLGCRTALSEFVTKYTDEEGKRWVDEEEFNDEIWDYEW